MGSPDPEHGRQLNGMGGGVSSLSKICVVGTPSAPQKARGIQVEYTFVQVGIKDDVIDYSGNCGNLSSIIGAFAVEQGICQPTVISASVENPGDGGVAELTGSVRSWNKNTQKVIDTVFPINKSGAPVLDLPQTELAGVPGKASRILMEFIDPAGARTGQLLPSGKPRDTLNISAAGLERTYQASLVDATNPTVFVLAEELKEIFEEGGKAISGEGYDTLEKLRIAGAEAMGLTPVAQAQPKIAVVGPPTSTNEDITVHALSMGVLHRAIPMTVGLCLGVAARIEGSVVQQVARASKSGIKIKHLSGEVEVLSRYDSQGNVLSAGVIRTGRWLMKGKVFW